MILGVACIAYYISICCYLKRMNSKFPRIWLAAGVLFLLWSQSPYARWEVLPLWGKAAIGILLLLFVAVELLVVSGMKERPGRDVAAYVIVLGAKVDGLHLTDALKQRLDRALVYLREHPETKVVVSGGQGPEEKVTEAYAMAQYLEKCGIAGERILREECSTTTRENLSFSGKMICDDAGTEKLGEIAAAVVTNSFHIYRAVHIAHNVGYKNIMALPARTTPIMLVNYMVREFFGVLKMWVQEKTMH